jgi:lysyl-tRNA synthetase class 2
MPEDRNPGDWMPGAGPDQLRARAEMLASIRDFFRQKGVLEVETPMLSSAGNSDPGIAQYCLREPPLFLRTSSEYPMKRLLAAGSGDIYELGRVFRAGEQGRYHNPEFTMLEWYRVGWSYRQLMDEVSELVRHCLPESSFSESRVSYRDLLQAYTGIDPLSDPEEVIRARIAGTDFEVPGLDRQAMLDLLVSHAVQAELATDAMTFVYDYPPEQAALARIRPDTPPVAERFELFLGQVELANGYQELTDAAEQRHRFERENRLRQQHGMAPAPIDERLLGALGAGLPECSGVALGVDRLLMRRVGARSLDEVLAFPASRS